MALESVTYQQRSLDGTLLATYEGVIALRRAVTGGLVSAPAPAGQFTANSARWHIEADTLPVTPRRGDRIVSAVDSTTWEILKADVDTLATRHACETRRVTG